MGAEFGSFKGLKRFGALDGLRAISVIAVIWQHTSGRPGPDVSRNGYLGVEFFFAISGFLITTLLLRENERTGGIALRKFYIRRVLRIFPLYYLVLLAYVVLTLLTASQTSTGRAFLSHLPAFLTYTSNWFVDLQGDSSVTFYFAWSLATEEQFYLLWPPLLVLFLWIFRGRGLTFGAWLLVALVMVDQAATLFGDGSILWVGMLGSMSTPILLGALLAILLNGKRSFEILAPVLGSRWSAPVIFAVLLVTVLFKAPIQLPQVLMVIAVGSVVIREDTLLHPALQWRPLAFIGVISYGVYLMHMLAANLVRVVIGQESTPLVFALTLPLVILAAWLSFRFFETPLLSLKRRFEAAPAHADALDRAAAPGHS